MTETLGKLAVREMQKVPGTRSVVELEREMQKDYLDELVKCTEEGKGKHKGDFYIVVITKNEKLLSNVFRNFFFTRISCPTPDYDQSLFRYSHHDDAIRYIWSIPSQDVCFHYKENAQYVDKSEHQLLDFILKFADGTLYKLAKEMNGESINSSIIQ